MTVSEAVTAGYPPAAAAGHVPPLAELAHRHPDVAAALTSLFPAGIAR
jgi:hypothetical protein